VLNTTFGVTPQTLYFPVLCCSGQSRQEPVWPPIQLLIVPNVCADRDPPEIGSRVVISHTPTSGQFLQSPGLKLDVGLAFGSRYFDTAVPVVVVGVGEGFFT
jgi:hypothetical protein